MTDRDRFIEHIESLLLVVRRMSDEEFARSRRLGVFPPQPKVRSTKSVSVSEDRLHEVAESLKASSSREEAARILNEAQELQSKEAVTRLAKLFRAHVMKQDSKQEIIEKIIEGAVGHRLRSEAIGSLRLRREGVEQRSESIPEG